MSRNSNGNCNQIFDRSQNINYLSEIRYCEDPKGDSENGLNIRT